MLKYIYQYSEWPKFSWSEDTISVLLGNIRNQQGRIFAQMSMLGFTIKTEATLNTLTLDVIKSSAIEGEILDYKQVRSSIAKRLGIPEAGLIHVPRNIEGVVEMMLDATQNFDKPLSNERLFGWHAALFPDGYSGMHRIEIGRYRTGEMQIVSGPMGRERIHYEAIPAKNLASEMEVFLNWLNTNNNLDPVLKAAIAHFWFIIIHPFDDGNGRIARAISDKLLAYSDGSRERYYSMSNHILEDKKNYYAILQKEQHSNGDITSWLVWFLSCLKKALDSTEKTILNISKKYEFWQYHEHTAFNERQRLLLNKLLDGFDGKLKSSKWAKIAKCSTDTALRDIKDLISKGVLQQEESGGRSTNYELVNFKDQGSFE